MTDRSSFCRRKRTNHISKEQINVNYFYVNILEIKHLEHQLTLLKDVKIGNKYGITSPGTGLAAKALEVQSEMKQY